MPEDAIWSTKEIILAIIGTGVISAVVSSVLTWGGDWVRTRNQSKREKSYLCARAAIALEAYAISCAEALNAATAHYNETKSALGIVLPDAPTYPTDLNWHSINPNLAYRLMSFLNECEALAAEARYAHHFESNPFEFEDAAKLSGKKAYELANEVRQIANISPPNLGRMLNVLH